MSFGAPAERLTDERTVLAIGLAHAAMDDPHGIHPNIWVELKQHFSDTELMELCFIIGHYSGNQLVNILLDTDVDPDTH
jgi:alkylhydroperoxidase family enzyme